MNKYSAREDLEFIKETKWWQSADGSNAPLGLMIGIFLLSYFGLHGISFLCVLCLVAIYITKNAKKATLKKVLENKKK